MATYASPFYVLLGIPLMAVCCWWLSRWFPLIDSVAQTHAVSLPLDGLRGILAPAVLFHHAYITYVFLKTGIWKLPESNFYFQLGPSAVTMFFFISAYLFWSKMLKNPENLRPSRLWPNRMRRILPAYWTAVALFFLLVAVMSGFHLRAPAAKLALSVASWIFAGFPGLNSPDLNGSEQVRVIGGIFWTLRVEWLFYFLLPALAWFRKG
jgi:peptidoglycan/LPS O-acetylase OafA/YrhL